MHLVEIFLPLTDNDGMAFDAALFTSIRDDLTRTFGGITAFTRAPAHGETREGGKPVHDDIVIYEVMTQTLDKDWWSAYRQKLERLLAQDTILIRATQITQL